MPDLEGMLREIRRLGWKVAVHNDYRQGGESLTFWLFTRSGKQGQHDQAVKGEGRSDGDALLEILEKIGSPLATK